MFDKVERKRLARRKKVSSVSTERNALMKGPLGVRWEKDRCNYAKMLTTDRMGIMDD